MTPSRFDDPPIHLNFEARDRCLFRDGLIIGGPKVFTDTPENGKVNGICLECRQTYVWVPIREGVGFETKMQYRSEEAAKFPAIQSVGVNGERFVDLRVKITEPHIPANGSWENLTDVEELTVCVRFGSPPEWAKYCTVLFDPQRIHWREMVDKCLSHINHRVIMERFPKWNLYSGVIRGRVEA